MKPKNAVRCIQINLHRAKAAAATLQRRFIQQDLEIGLIQEPWTVKDRITGLASKNGKLIYSANGERPRAALLLNTKVSYFPLTKFISRDLVSAKIEVPTERGTQRIVIAAAYFPSEDKNPPPPKLADLINYCNRHNFAVMRTPIINNGVVATPMKKVSAYLNLL
jgi:hypothetical protein